MLARAIRQQTFAEEEESLKRAEEDAIIEDSSDHVGRLFPAQQALKLARVTRETLLVSHQTILRRVQVAEQMLSCLQDQLEESSSWVQDADMQVGEVLEVLASMKSKLDPADVHSTIPSL